MAINASTLKRLMHDIKPVGPLTLDEVRFQYDGIFKVEETGTGFLLTMDGAKVTKLGGEYSAKFMVQVPSRKLQRKGRCYWPFEEVIDDVDPTDVANAIACSMFGDCVDEPYGAVLGDLNFDSCGNPQFTIPTRPMDINFAMFYTKQDISDYESISKHTIIRTHDLWVVMIPFYLVANLVGLKV